jgi:hypothetical protein
MAEMDVTPTSVAANLAHLARELAALTTGLGDLELRSVNAREDYIMSQAKAFLRAEGPVDVRKYQSLVDTHDERLSAETADALVRQRRAQIAAIKVRIDVGRSVGAVVRAEIDLERAR